MDNLWESLRSKGRMGVACYACNIRPFGMGLAQRSPASPARSSSLFPAEAVAGVPLCLLDPLVEVGQQFGQPVPCGLPRQAAEVVSLPVVVLGRRVVLHA